MSADASEVILDNEDSEMKLTEGEELPLDQDQGQKDQAKETKAPPED